MVLAIAALDHILLFHLTRLQRIHPKFRTKTGHHFRFANGKNCKAVQLVGQNHHILKNVIFCNKACKGHQFEKKFVEYIIVSQMMNLIWFTIPTIFANITCTFENPFAFLSPIMRL
jgi:hypothetical protein